MSKNPESVPFVRQVMQISQTGEHWFLLALHAAVVDQFAYNTVRKITQPFFCKFESEKSIVL
ncbi:MAG: hypothetical protein A2X24_03290 [Chloroflexi bacterium GWB2_54_36]|nr:MAG: hypothetical protein A2X24_03290 [Chloroflexi bacterium GWB2_54_36]